MQNLIRFFIQYSNILLFVVLEIFCVSIIISKNESQQEIYQYNKNLLSGYIFSEVQRFNNFLHLSEIADSLAIENANLRSELRNAKFRLVTDQKTVKDSVYLQEFTYLNARVISNSIHLQNNRMIIDIGKNDGVDQGMGVIADRGVVGIIAESSDKFSLVLPILHSQSKISAAIKRNAYFGSLTWSGIGSQDFKLKNVPKHADVIIGDTIITSGYSTIFPKGIEIGRIDNVKEIKGSNEYDIDTKIYLNVAKINRVYVVKNLFREEFDNLININAHE